MKKFLGTALVMILWANVTLATEPIFITLARWRGHYSGFGPSESLTGSRFGETLVTVKLTGVEFKRATSEGKISTQYYSYSDFKELDPPDYKALASGSIAFRAGGSSKDHSEIWFVFRKPKASNENSITVMMKADGIGLAELSRNFTTKAIAASGMKKQLNGVEISDRL